MSPSVRQTQDAVATAERRQAIRGLLATPLIGQREDPETYAGIVRHRRHLGEWFAEHTGWHLVVDESGGFARLHKTAAGRDATRAAVSVRDRRPFDRRRYVLLCLTLAALDQRPGQTSLRRLAEAVVAASGDQRDVASFDPSRMTERRAFVDVLKALAAMGIVVERDGDSERYAATEGADALYDIDDRRLAQLIAAPSSPSLVSGPDELPVEVYPDTEEGQRLRARHRVLRRLLDRPICYYDELTERERDWLTHSLAHVHDLLDRDVGLRVERRREGLAAIDPERELSDEAFPDGGSTVKHAALLLAEQLTAMARQDRAGRLDEAGHWTPPIVGDADAHRLTAELIDQVGRRCRWSGQYLESDRGAESLTADALGLLARFGLVARVPGGWVPRPAIARFAPAAPTRGTAAAAQEALFDSPAADHEARR